jgi:hypothetical protein
MVEGDAVQDRRHVGKVDQGEDSAREHAHRNGSAAATEPGVRRLGARFRQWSQPRRRTNCTQDAVSAADEKRQREDDCDGLLPKSRPGASRDRFIEGPLTHGLFMRDLHRVDSSTRARPVDRASQPGRDPTRKCPLSGAIQLGMGRSASPPRSGRRSDPGRLSNRPAAPARLRLSAGCCLEPGVELRVGRGPVQAGEMVVRVQDEVEVEGADRLLDDARIASRKSDMKRIRRRLARAGVGCPADVERNRVLGGLEALPGIRPARSWHRRRGAERRALRAGRLSSCRFR